MDADTDQVVNAKTAAALSADVRRDHPLSAWIVIRDQPWPGAFTARLVAAMPTPYVLMAETLGKLHAQLPPGLIQCERQPWEPPDLVALWLRTEAEQGRRAPAGAVAACPRHRRRQAGAQPVLDPVDRLTSVALKQGVHAPLRTQFWHKSSPFGRGGPGGGSGRPAAPGLADIPSDKKARWP
ncbi:MAG: hypothetical protein ACJ8AI_04745 [Rhodopila sp.]